METALQIPVLNSSIQEDTMINLTAYLSDLAGCGFYRIAQPLLWLEERRRANIKLLNITSMTVHKRFTQLLIIQRQFHENIIGHLQNLKDTMQMPIVYELDDDLWAISRNSPAYATYHKTDILGRAEKCIGMCDVATTTTTSLAKTLKKFNDKVYVLPNTLDFRSWRTLKKHENKNPLTIGWFGSQTHFEDLQEIHDVLMKIIKEFPNIKLKFMGYLYPPLKEYIKSGRVEVVQGVKVELYPRHAQLHSPDIGIIPVKKTTFNDAKSSLKFMEMSAMGIPSICSNDLPYSSVVEHEKTGYLANNKDTDKWLEHIEKLVRSVELRNSMGLAAYQWIKNNRSIANNYWQWDRVYRGVLNKDYESIKDLEISNIDKDIN